MRTSFKFAFITAAVIAISQGSEIDGGWSWLGSVVWTVGAWMLVVAVMPWLEEKKKEESPSSGPLQETQPPVDSL